MHPILFQDLGYNSKQNKEVFNLIMLTYFLGRRERWQTSTYVKYISCNTMTSVMEKSEKGKREKD